MYVYMHTYAHTDLIRHVRCSIRSTCLLCGEVPMYMYVCVTHAIEELITCVHIMYANEELNLCACRVCELGTDCVSTCTCTYEQYWFHIPVFASCLMLSSATHCTRTMYISLLCTLYVRTSHILNSKFGMISACVPKSTFLKTWYAYYEHRYLHCTV